MSFTNTHNLEIFEREFRNAGYESNIRDPFDISDLVKGDKVIDCEVIARKDFYNILYMEAESNWRGIATDVIKKNQDPCLVITAYKETHIILSTKRDPLTLHAKPRYVVIDTKSKTHSLNHFIKLIKATQDDDFISIDGKVQAAFDKFSTYKQAIDEFGEHLEMAIRNTREVIVRTSTNNKKYDIESEKFLDMCRKVISNKLELGDITELLLQHVMTYRIFALIYDEHDLHTTNAVARSLEGLMNTLEIDVDAVSANYKTIELVAESITDATEKQDFLKQVYETFYAKYDPKNKDSWGIAYTPSEVVDFMVRSTEYLLDKHFHRCLSDDNVTILDPATGTGTFVTSILRHLKPDSLEAKYKNDIFANDISILAYYIAALNIENAYQAITGKIKEFENICWMDTLTSGTKDFGKLSAYIDGQDNVKRISRQQQKDICVVLGNPPYNMAQVSSNDANPAVKYKNIDDHIKETYQILSTAVAKNSTQDMYMRFMKWASERIKNNGGMVAFVSNNSFLDGKANDGFRRSVYKEFDYIYTVNLKGNARLAGDAWRREGGKIFGSGARVGVAITFFLKTGEGKSEIQYAEVDDCTDRENKLKWLANNSLSTLPLRYIVPDEDAIWINPTYNDFDELIQVVSDTKNAVFEIRSYGSQSNRDEWVYNFDEKSLENKMKYFIDFYNKTLKKYFDEKPSTNIIYWTDKKIKWTDDLFKHVKRGNKITYSNKNFKNTLYRPFVSKFQYSDKIITHRPGKFSNIFKNSKSNRVIGFTNPATNSIFQTLATDMIINSGCVGDTSCIPLYMYDDNHKSHSNVTKFGLELFQTHYKNNKITDEDIFYYTYAIFNDPKYREKYKFNLQRKFPRIPLAKDFKEWVKIGKKLYDIHVGFEDTKSYLLKRIEKNTSKNKTRLILKKPKNEKSEQLKIIIDDKTTLENVPDEALQYKFSSKCALEWILEFYKESKNMISDKSCDDPQIKERFNTYKFADHKEYVIDLLQKVTTVSIETIKLRKELEKMPWGPQSKLDLKEESEDNKKPRKPKIVKKPRKPKDAQRSKKYSTKSKRTAKLQDTLDGAGQKRLF